MQPADVAPTESPAALTAKEAPGTSDPEAVTDLVGFT
jgi:hypothetical protein